MIGSIREFLRMDIAGGVLLLAAAALAMLLANSPLAQYYHGFLDIPVAVLVGPFEIHKPMVLWINDGLMALFFFLVGLELKREAIEGELRDPRQVVLPAVCALGGMVVPALIYAAINHDNPEALAGWAIPSATDIAFALGVLMLVGPVPVALKVFLVTVAVFDDVGAIIIIALFYTSKLSTVSMMAAAAVLMLLTLLRLSGVRSVAAYVLVGTMLWAAVLKSGVHATLAGVVLALFIPIQRDGQGRSPLHELEHSLQPVVAKGVLPLFAFANAGLTFTGLTWSDLLHGVPMGIALGLFVGKQLGVFGLGWLLIRLGVARLPQGVSWLQLYGVSLLCGIGFTMSLFIGSLAFAQDNPVEVDERLGILLGSFLSAVVGALVLRRAAIRSAHS